MAAKFGRNSPGGLRLARAKVAFLHCFAATNNKAGETRSGRDSALPFPDHPDGDNSRRQSSASAV
jgi:hypothetical protein